MMEAKFSVPAPSFADRCGRGNHATLDLMIEGCTRGDTRTLCSSRGTRDCATPQAWSPI